MKPERFGRYEVIDKLGQGGMAEVFRARDPEMERQVAIKVLPVGPNVQNTALLRFQQEVTTIATLEHPAIVPIYDVGMEDGRPFFVMRYMTGGKLSQYLTYEPLSIDMILEIMRRLSAALDKAHRTGIVHRDIKSDNILLDEEGKAYLSDFGIAKLLENNAGFTMKQAVIGTLEYMSPEQIQGGDIDGSTDIYALGVLVYQMLVGRLPYTGSVGEIMAQHLAPGTPNILAARPDLPVGCERVIAQAMAQDKADRFHSATAMAEALAGAFGRSLDPSEPRLPRLLQETAAALPSETQLQSGGLTDLLPPAILTTSMIIQRRLKQLPTWAKWSLAILPLLLIAYFSLPQVVADDGQTGSPTAAAATSTPVPTATSLPSATPLPLSTSPAVGMLRILQAGDAAILQIGQELQRIPEDGRIPITATQQTISLQSDADRLELLLPDSTKLYLDGNTVLDFLQLAGVDEAEVTAVRLQSGRLALVPARSGLVVMGADEQPVKVVDGLTGVELSDHLTLICLEEECRFEPDTAEPLEVANGQQIAFPPDETPVGPLPAPIEPYMLLLNPVPTLTATPTLTPTTGPTPTPSLTPIPTLDPTRVGPEVLAIGTSALGQTIDAVRFGDGPEVFIFVSGLQGGYAPNGLELAEAMITYFSENLHLIPERATLYIIPHINPDSPLLPGQLEARLNANGVDLNRNWPCNWDPDPWILTQNVAGGGGTGPYSEPETQVLINFIVEKEPTAVMFWMAHRQAGFVSPGGCEPQSKVSLSLSQLYATAANYDYYEEGEAIADSSLQGDASNSLDELGIPTATALLSFFSDIDWEENLAGTLAVLNEYTPPVRATTLVVPTLVSTPAATTTACLDEAASRWMTTLYAEYAADIGCPLTSAQQPRATFQLYENGLMVWRQDTETIYVLYYDGVFATYAANLSQGATFFEDDLHKGPMGYLWDSNNLVRQQLGAPEDSEMGTSEFTLQDFMSGTIFYFTENRQNTYVLLAGTRQWRAIQEK